MLDRKEAVAADEGQTVEESVSYDNKTIIPTVFPTTIAMQQLIYIQNYYGDTFTPEQKEKFGLYLKEEALEEHKFEYRMGNKYGPNWEFYHKPYLTQKGIAIPDLPAFWDYYFEVCSEHPITALESYQKLTGIIWASVGYGPTAFRGYAYDDFTQYVSKGYASFMQPAKEALDNTVFGLYNGFFIIFNRPALYLFVILLFCFAGIKRHKSKYSNRNVFRIFKYCGISRGNNCSGREVFLYKYACIHSGYSVCRDEACGTRGGGGG